MESRCSDICISAEFWSRIYALCFNYRTLDVLYLFYELGLFKGFSRFI